MAKYPKPTVATIKQKYLVRPDPKDLDIFHIMALLPALPYHIVADIGCASGEFSVSLGKWMYRGKVFAVDSVKKNLTATSTELKRINLTNVETILWEKGKKLPFEEGTLDGVFASFLLQESKAPTTVLRSAYKCLNKGGWIALMEWSRSETNNSGVLRTQISPVEYRALAEQVGFRFTMRHYLSDEHYMLLLRK